MKPGRANNSGIEESVRAKPRSGILALNYTGYPTMQYGTSECNKVSRGWNERGRGRQRERESRCEVRHDTTAAQFHSFVSDRLYLE